tara:strand:+ start:303 stop:692 length:390 start_codon:yes stop_codon:yes gene_type:complete
MDHTKDLAAAQAEAAKKEGGIRPRIKKIIDKMTEDIAMDILLSRSNRAATIDWMTPYMESWIPGIRWEEENYADIAAQSLLGFFPQFSVHYDTETGEESYSSAAYRHTRRFYYMTTDDDGNEIEKESYL